MLLFSVCVLCRVLAGLAAGWYDVCACHRVFASAVYLIKSFGLLFVCVLACKDLQNYAIYSSNT